MTLDKALKNLDEFTHLPMSELISLVSTNALTLCNQQSQRGSLEEKFIADIVIVNEKKEVMFTIAHGNILYDKEHKG